MLTSIPFRFTVGRQIRLITNTNGDTARKNGVTGWADLMNQDQLDVLDEEPSCSSVSLVTFFVSEDQRP